MLWKILPIFKVLKSKYYYNNVIDGGNLNNYKIEGNGEVIVLIHGLSDDLRYWEVLATALKKDFKVIRYDLRGHGQSPLGSGEITSSTYVDDLNDLLIELGIDKVNLVGFSVGGAIALDFTLRFPQKVKSIVLMSSFYKADDYVLDIFSQFKKALSINFEEFYDLILPKVLCPDVIDKNRDDLNVLKEIASQNANLKGYVTILDSFSDFNVEDRLGDIDVPALIFAGKYDDIFDVNMQKEMSDKITNSKLIVLDNLKHNLLVGKNNVEIINILYKFYEKIG